MKQKICFLIVYLITFLTYSQDIITVSEITINGNKVTQENIILREIVFKENNSFSITELESKIKESKNNLINLKLFNFAEIDYVLIGRKAKVTINLTERWYIWPYPVFEISERNFNSWWEEFKTSNYSDFSRLNYGLFLNWNNFRGKNEIVQLKIRSGFKEHYLLSYQMPYLNKKKTIGLNTNLQLFRRKKTFYQTTDNTLRYFEKDDEYTSIDHTINLELLYRKGIDKKHKLKCYYFNSLIADSIAILNQRYLNNDGKSGDYFKATYEFTQEKRDYIIYPLHGYFIEVGASKYFKGSSPVNHFEFDIRAAKHIEPKKSIFLGSSIALKLTSKGYQPYFQQEGFGFNDYVRGYEYYVIDGQQFCLSKTILKYALVEKTNFEIPYMKMKQFKKSHYSIYLGLFSDMGYIKDSQNTANNPMESMLLWGRGVSLDYVTYYDKLLRIEFSINHLGEKGVFLHFSNPFGSKKKL